MHNWWLWTILAYFAGSVPFGLIIGIGLGAGMIAMFDTELYRIPLVVSARTLATAALTVIGAGLFSSVVVRRRLDRLDLIAVLKTRE